jgi:hypothetical protein
MPGPLDHYRSIGLVEYDLDAVLPDHDGANGAVGIGQQDDLVVTRYLRLVVRRQFAFRHGNPDRLHRFRLSKRQ